MKEKMRARIQKHNPGQYIFGISVYNSRNHIGIFFDLVMFSVVIEYYKQEHFGHDQSKYN